MTSIAVVASAHDAKFAEEVRAALQAAGLDASVSQSLPKAASPHVVLIWSAALEAARAIDAQALIGLWSEDRLHVVRRDATPLPLGLRDLPSLGPEANSKEVAAAARAATADRPIAPELKQLSRRYELVRVIGKGSMGIVYEAMDPRLHRKVAIKTILKGHMDDDDAAKEYSMRFMREAQAVARLNHPHIVQVYDFGEEAEVAYIVMEFISGKDLKSFFDAKIRFELKEAVRIMCELLDALDFAHEAGIVHRDVKPANVMLDGQARVKLADFGVARIADDRPPKEKAQAGVVFGGLVYMSPEQITGGAVDRRSDIFLAGIILYQLLTGEKAFTGPGAWAVAKKIIQDHPPVPSSINNTISPLFDNVVNKALSKAVDGRYQTAKEFSVALRRALEGKSDEEESDKIVVGSLGDLSSLTKPSVSVAAARTDAAKTSAIGSQEVELEFWRAIKDGNDPDDFELYVQQFPNGIYAALAKRKLAKLRGTALEDANATELEKREVEEAGKREAEFKQKLVEEKAKLEAQLAAKEAESATRGAEAAKRETGSAKKLSDATRSRAGMVIAAILVIALVGGGGWYYFNKASFEKQAALTAALETATKASQELQQAQAKQLESLKALEQARADEEAARKSGDLAKLKEAQDAAKRAEAEAANQGEAVKQREVAAADARKKAQESAESAKKAEVPTAAPAMESPKSEAPKAEVPRAEEPTAKAPAPPDAGVKRLKSRSEREREEETRLARQAALKENVPVAAASPSPAASVPALPTADMFQQAQATESSDPRGAVKIYRSLARNGNGKAAKRLGEIYDKGIAGVSRDYAESLQWYETARKLGETIESSSTRAEATPAARPAEPEASAAVQPAPSPAPPVVAAIPEVARPEPKSAAAKSAPLVREPARPAPAARPEPPPEPVRKAEPAPAPAPATIPEPPKAAVAAPAASPVADLFHRAQGMEASDPLGAVKIYRSLARDGNGKAAKRLGEIYDGGLAGIPREYAESLQWYETARKLGETVETAGERDLEWFPMRGLLIALLVLALIAWRRSRRRKKAEARRAQRESAAIDSSSAQLAVLIANVSGSTKLYEIAGDQVAKAAIDECVRIMRDCTGEAKGSVITSAGDEITCSFPSADAAADAAIQMQEGIAELKPIGNSKIGIRIGICCGPLVVQADGGVAGDGVDVAARLSHVAVKGQIITARDTVMLMSPMLKAATRKITAIQIEGKAAEVEVYELMWRHSEDVTTLAAARSVYKPKKTKLRLVLRGEEHVLGDDVTAVSMGREAAADLVITDHMASLTHGKIERRLDKFVLTDHSANGTFVTVDGGQEIVLRREEFTLRGKGWIALGQSRTAAAEVVEYYTEDLRTDPKPEATLFVSYSHKDRSRVEPIVSVIEEMGRRVWMDRSDITGQTGWAGQIVRAIRECRAVVLMASPNSYTSDQVVRELYLAMNHKKTIVPIEIEPAEMPDELQYILAPFQHHRLSGRETREVIGRALAAV